MGKIIAITNQKGGVGKTTTSVNLAAALGVKNQKTLLIDIDPQGNATSGVGVDKRQLNISIYDVLIQNVPIVKSVLKTKFKNLYIIPSSIDLAGAELELVDMPNREHILKNEFDYIIKKYGPEPYASASSATGAYLIFLRTFT